MAKRGAELCKTAKKQILDLVYAPIKGVRSVMNMWAVGSNKLHTAIIGTAWIVFAMQIGILTTSICILVFPNLVSPRGFLLRNFTTIE